MPLDRHDNGSAAARAARNRRRSLHPEDDFRDEAFGGVSYESPYYQEGHPEKAWTGAHNPEPSLMAVVRGQIADNNRAGVDGRAPDVIPQHEKDSAKLRATRADFERRTAGQAAEKQKIMDAYNKSRRR